MATTALLTLPPEVPKEELEKRRAQYKKFADELHERLDHELEVSMGKFDIANYFKSVDAVRQCLQKLNMDELDHVLMDMFNIENEVPPPSPLPVSPFPDALELPKEPTPQPQPAAPVVTPAAPTPTPAAVNSPRPVGQRRVVQNADFYAPRLPP